MGKKEQSKKDVKPSVSKEEAERKSRNYFGSDGAPKKEVPTSSNVISKEAATEFIKNISEKYAAKELAAKNEEKKSGMMVKFDLDSYAECYPGYFSQNIC